MFRPWYRYITMHNRITNCVLSASASLMYRCTTTTTTAATAATSTTCVKSRTHRRRRQRRKSATRITMHGSRIPIHGQYDHDHHSQHEHDPGASFQHASGTQIRIVTTRMRMEQRLLLSASTSASASSSLNAALDDGHRHAVLLDCWNFGIAVSYS